MWHHIAITEKTKQVRYITSACGIMSKVIDFTDEPVAQCDVPAVKDALLDDDDNENRK